MTKYFLRNDQGRLVARMPGKLAYQMFEEFSGQFTQKLFKDNTSKNCFVFNQEGSVTLHTETMSTSIYFFPGYYLVPDKP